MAGVTETLDLPRLRRMIFRSTKGKSYVYTSEVDDAGDPSRPNMSVYIVVFQDGRQMGEKIEKICDSFSGYRCELPPLSGIPAKIKEVKA